MTNCRLLTSSFHVRLFFLLSQIADTFTHRLLTDQFRSEIDMLVQHHNLIRFAISHFSLRLQAPIPLYLSSKDEFAMLCSACVVSIKFAIKADEGQKIPHHRSVESLAEASRAGCYICWRLYHVAGIERALLPLISELEHQGVRTNDEEYPSSYDFTGFWSFGNTMCVVYDATRFDKHFVTRNWLFEVGKINNGEYSHAG